MSVAVSSVSVAYGDKAVLDDFSLTLPERGVFVLFGPSGSGKTTLLDLLSGLLVPTKGAITGLEGATVARAFQDNRFIPWLSVAENIACVLTKATLARIASDDAFLSRLSLEPSLATPEAITQRVLSLVGLEQEATALPDQLSGGMQKRLGLGRTLAADASVVLLDEPTVGLDEAAARTLLDRSMACWDDRLVVLVTHDHALAERYGAELAEVGGPPLEVQRRQSLKNR